MAGELLKSQAKISAVHIPYAGAAPAQLGLLAGQTDFMFDNLASALTQVKAGKLRAFAVTTTRRAESMPDVPTMAESGLPGFDVSTWFGVFAPAGTPAAIVERREQGLHGRAAVARDARAAGAHGSGAGADVAGRIRSSSSGPNWPSTRRS